MSSSTLRRLAKDHKSLHADLPPNFLFPPSNAPDSVPDDLSRLTILLAGPQGTPYSRGVWKLQIKIPDDYPRSPPKAAFRTRIWHPNVEESTGSVCVETLKRDWDPKLTLRDVLVTISCLLIQPNPDSALNSAAGQLLQEDYEAYARQAKLMTSIHALIPAELREAVTEAKKRGEEAGTELREDQEQESKTTCHFSASSVVMKTRPTLIPRILAVSDSTSSTASARPTIPHLTIHPPPTTPEDTPSSDSDSDCELSAHKENDPSLSPSPVSPPPAPRRPVLAKRPLSDLPTPTEPDPSSSSLNQTDNQPSNSSSSQNIANNNNHPAPVQPTTTPTDPPRRSPKLADRSKAFPADQPLVTPFEDASSLDDNEAPAPKRICSGEGKENFSAPGGGDKSAAAPKVAGAVRSVNVGRQGRGRGRVGLRRL